LSIFCSRCSMLLSIIFYLFYARVCDRVSIG
jgi:hypothetical protein